MKLYNHIAPKLSALEWQMIQHIPPGGNWQSIPETIPSQRLAQIRKSGGRTTYYGRLKWDKPAFTITTYFNRLGNGSNLHPAQNRIISIREGARLQSFSDQYIFFGSKSAQYKQIGNAVPPLLARVIAGLIKPHLRELTFVDLFAGAGGMSEGFLMEEFNLLAANELEPSYFETFKRNHQQYDRGNNFITGDITSEDVQKSLLNSVEGKKVGVIVGGPPCQGFSHAGWRNPNDKRNQLFKEFVNVVDSVKPEFFVMENVPGILTMRKGEAIKEIITAFQNIGYHVNSPMKLHAEDFGVPQKRRRVFIIGSLQPINLTHPKPLFGLSNKPNIITVKDALDGLPPLKTAEGSFEITCKYKASSAYEELLMGQITFDEFYQKNQVELPILCG